MTRTLLDMACSAAGLAILVLDETDLVVDLSTAAGQLLRRDRDRVIGRPVCDILALDPVRAAIQAQPPGHPPGPTLDIALRDTVHTDLRIALTAMRWTDPDGRLLTTLFLRDVAAEKELARITHNHLVQSDNAIRGAGIGVFEYDPVANTITVSDIWRQMLEIAPDERLDVQQEWRSRVHPEDLGRALEPVSLCADGRAERAHCEYRLRARDGTSWRWMRTDIAVAERDAAGRPSLLVGAQTDITDRKMTEESLRVSVAQFRSAFFNAPIGKAIVELGGAIRIVNPALCEMLGYSQDEMRRLTFVSVTHPDDLQENMQQFQSLIAGEVANYTLEKRYIRSSGAVMWGRLSAGLVRDADGRPDHIVSHVVDITEERRLDDLRSEFVSVVSHELRTPLTSVLAALTLLEFEDQGFSDEVQRLHYIAKTNGDRLHNLIDDILDYQKFTAKEMRFALAPHAMHLLVEETLLANLALTDRYGVRFVPPSFVAPLIGPLVGLVDPRRFHQIMANLLSNAAKFSEPGSVVTLAVQPDGADIRITVTNTGAGIPDSFRDRIFRPFSQAATISDRRSGGTGLGLSITKQIVEQMGGDIGFVSTPGDRTTFWFTVRGAEAAG